MQIIGVPAEKMLGPYSFAQIMIFFFYGNKFCFNLGQRQKSLYFECLGFIDF